MATSEVLISFFESRQSAERGLALIQSTAPHRWCKPQAVVVGRDVDGSRPRVDPPATRPVGAVVGTGLGLVLGWPGAEAGMVIGFFFGLYVGLLLDAWRILGRGDLVDEVQEGLGPGQAAIVLFLGRSSAEWIEQSLTAGGGITLHRFQGTPIEDDLEREVRDASIELRRLVEARDGQIDFDRDISITSVRRRLATLEAVTDRLLSHERLEFAVETRLLDQELRHSPAWRAIQIRRRVADVRALHRQSRSSLEASRNRIHAVQSLAESDEV